MVVAAWRLLLLLLAVCPLPVFVKALDASHLQKTDVATVLSFINYNPPLPHPVDGCSRGPSAVVRRRSFPHRGLSREKEESQVTFRSSFHASSRRGRKVLTARAAAEGGSSERGPSLFDSQWAQQHLVGVWEFHLPKVLFSSSFFAPFIAAGGTKPPNPLPLWINEDAAVSCPDLDCKGLVTPHQLTADKNSQDTAFCLRISPVAAGGLEFELKGLLAYSSSPSISLWKDRIHLHSAVVAGAVFARTSKVNRAAFPFFQRRARDSSGRVVMSGGHSASAEKESEKQKAADYVGGFTGYRILGEDQNELRIRHAFLQHGPRRLYNVVNPDEQHAAHAFFQGKDCLLASVGGAQLRCGAPGGPSFQILKAALLQEEERLMNSCKQQ
ncbi:hypothetical protein Efla_006799 [Eimeria flavescens]